jgi:hypothetical protein
MTSVVDPKAYWDLLETVWWICTRDEEQVSAMQGMSEEDRVALGMFGRKAEYDPLPLLALPEAEFTAARQLVSPQDDEKALRIDEPILPARAMDDLFAKVSSGRVRMTAVRFGSSSDGQIPVPLAELNGLMFRIATGDRIRVGLWSRSRGTLVWSSPQFLRADVIRAWPARNKKTAGTSRAILRYLRQIMTPETPLTKREAQQRCMAEVMHAYPEAFKRAWAELEPSCKKGRGKHGPRLR